MNLFWHVADILSGRRRHWNTVCAPTVIECLLRADSLERRVAEAIRIVLAAAWGTFSADFSRGPFRVLVKTLDAHSTRRILSMYMSYLVQSCSLRKLWSAFNLPEQRMWAGIIAVLPECSEHKRDVCELDGQQLAEQASRMYMKIWESVFQQLPSPEDLLRSRWDIPYLKLYHPLMLSGSSERIALRLAEELGGRRGLQ